MDAAIMTNHLRYDLQQLGFLAPASSLTRLGHSRTVIDTAVEQGWLTRPVRPWLATLEARQDAVIAVSHHGVLTNSSALESYGVWRGLDTRTHVRLRANNTGRPSTINGDLSAFMPSRVPGGGLVRHWARVGDDLDTAAWRASPLEALTSFAKSQSIPYFIAAVESALHLHVFHPRQLTRLAERLPARLRPYLATVDGRSEAGTETLARLGLAPLGRRVEIQVTVGPHRLDILIDGWLNIEIDSEEWHGKDRLKFSQRDTWLVGRGYWVLRFDYSEVMYEWPACIAAIRETLSSTPGGFR